MNSILETPELAHHLFYLSCNFHSVNLDYLFFKLQHASAQVFLMIGAILIYIFQHVTIQFGPAMPFMWILRNYLWNSRLL